MSPTKKQGCWQISGINSKEAGLPVLFLQPKISKIHTHLNFLTFPDCQRLGALA